jgi:starch phosphorylase
MVRFPVRCGVNIQAFVILNRLPMRRIIISGQTRSFYAAKDNGDVAGFDERKKIMKYRGFKIVSDQTGNIFNPDVFTMVWARRFAGYKRADLLLEDQERFRRLMENEKYPIQIIWAGKPYPLDYPAISTFNRLVEESKKYKNMAVLTGYEIYLSKSLKKNVRCMAE